MSVAIVCDKCEKRLTIPETVVGRSIKCPACGAVFKADPTKVQAAATRPAAAKPDGEDGAPAAAKLADDEARAVKKKTAAEDEAVDVVPVKKSAVIIEDDDEPPPPRRRRGRRVDDYDDYEDDYDDEPRGKPVTAWYVMLPLIILSFSAVGLALMWPIGFSWLGMDKDVSMSNDARIWIGIGVAVHVVLLCLIFSLMPTRAWVRFVIVLLLLALAYGESWAVMHWWKQLPFGHEEKAAQPAIQPRLDRGGFPPPFGPDDGGPP
jgi:hypothetical protein